MPEIYKQTENLTVKPTEIKGRKYLYVISCPNLNQTKSPTNFHNINWIQDSTFRS